MAQSLKSFLLNWRGIPSLLVVQHLLICRNEELNYCRELSNWLQIKAWQVPLYLCGIYAWILLAAESSCVIPKEIRRIRLASFGPIREQIEGWCEAEHTQLALKTVGSWVNKCPACLGTAHLYRGADMSQWTMTDTPAENALKQGLAKFYYIWPVSIDCGAREDQRLCHQF